jgi:hypothetical protein
MAAYHQALTGKGPLPVTQSDTRRPLGLVAVLYHSADLGCDLAPPITLGHPESEDRRPERLKHSAAPPAMAGG